MSVPSEVERLGDGDLDPIALHTAWHAEQALAALTAAVDHAEKEAR